MRNNSLYIRLKQIAFDDGYTVKQAHTVTVQQIEHLLNVSGLSSVFIVNMKRIIVRDLQQRDDEADMQRLKQHVTTWLDSNFPDWQAERGREDNLPYVTIWLEGASEVEESE